ncbi:MAG: hypothetical protein Kow0029_09290 [Candidatus Rifleibacteriota bacterium]
MYIKNRLWTAIILANIVLCAITGTPVANAASGKIIDVTHILMNEIQLPERNRTRAAAGVSFADIDPEQPAREKKIGQKDLFWVRNVQSGQFEQISANLMAIGKHCYVYVAEDQSVSQTAIDKIQNKFDQVIYPVNTNFFGSEWKPGIDGDNRVYLLMSDIKDGYTNPNDGYVAGYFFAGDEMMQSDFESDRVKTNEKEIIYLDTYPCNPDADDYMEVVAHEFQHMIHYNQDSKEVTWVNEGCSQIAPVLCGFPAPKHYKLFKNSPYRSLNDWAKWDPMPDYGQVYIWNQFILDTLNRKQIDVKDFYRTLTASKKVSIGGYIDAFSKFGMSFSEVFTDFSLANHLNNPNIADGRFSYSSSHLINFKMPEVKLIDTFPALEKNSVNIWSSVSYLLDLSTFTGNLKLSFSGYRRFMGPTYPYFRVAVALFDSSNNSAPKLSFMKLAPNPADKNRLIGSLLIKSDGTYDKASCVLMALAPEEVNDTEYMPAAGFIYDLRIETNSPFVAEGMPTMSVRQFVDKINSTASMTRSENAVKIRETYAHCLLLSIRKDLEQGSLKAVDEFIEIANVSNKYMAPFARDIAGMLRFYLTVRNNLLKKEDLQARIDLLDSF